MTEQTTTVESTEATEPTEAPNPAPAEVETSPDAEIQDLLRQAEEATRNPEAPAPTPTPAPVPAPRTGNTAYADEVTRAQVTQFMDRLREAGYTRPELTRLTGFNDSTVWRAQNSKVHTVEVEVWLEKVFRPFKDGTLPAPAASLRKPKPEALLARIAQLEAEANARVAAVQARIDRAVEALTSTDGKSIKQLRDVVSAAHAALVEDEAAEAAETSKIVTTA